ncbi:hypothetical protein [Mycolicibacterium mageritense]|uniref:Uncharacterized protein n=1 Tax=Mycolicibacterium mageritense TaxID=53462 RepID=A0ABM7HYR1_MYCME|nr:hypothetical protein [Mycolicibacterium mageritense]BBX35750.1 hypothetical protein MMAGJ_50320 [Mycolicibacterium mageritense]CDO19746.1 hypothetical protein BN978_00196 [Mycolicibacterium mageritense DSM 44476 = CIP 104973]
MIRTKFDGLIKSMTTSVFASLPTAWPEYLTGYGGRGTLLARVHENSYRRLSDGTMEQDVIERALVYMPDDEIQPAHLRRLTIRYNNTELDYDYLKLFPEMQEHAVSRVEQYRRCVEQIKTLPVIDFWELVKTWPVVG